MLDEYMASTMQQFAQLFNVNSAADEEVIKNIPQAMQSADWDGVGGWKRCTEDELKRCIVVHKALELRTQGDYDRTLALFGPTKVHLQHLVLVFKQKWLAKNDKDRKKVRLTVGDMKVKGKVENTYAPTVAFDSTRLLIQLGVRRGARRTTKGVSGAYLFGKPTPPEADGGRFLFVKVPPRVRQDQQGMGG